MRIGVAEWVDAGRAILRNWPIFANFGRNILPEFLLRLAHQDRMPAPSAFNDASFSLCGGGSSSVELRVEAGTQGCPTAERLEVPKLPGAGLEPAWSRLRGIFVLATAFAAESYDSFGVWTFSLPWSECHVTLNVRQGPSSLYTFPKSANATTQQGQSSRKPALVVSELPRPHSDLPE
jgi:hypothetical protein